MTKATRAKQLKSEGHSVQQIARIMNESPFWWGSGLGGSEMGLYESLEQELERVSVGDYEAEKRVVAIIKEADELMEEMAEALEQAVTSMQDSGYSNKSVAVMAGQKALAKYKDQTK